MAQLPTGTVTFLFTDIEHSTRLQQRLGSAYAQALGDHQALLRAAFAAHSGAEVDTQGDAFFVAFARALDAVAAAAQAQVALAAHPWPDGSSLQVRMGLHSGTPQLVGDHYVGLDVVVAARIAAAGHGGQVLLSQTTRDLAEHTLPKGVTLRDLGSHRLKDLQHAEHLYQLVLPGLPTDFPPLKTLDVHPNNLPLQPTPLLGREEAVAALCALLRRENVRLVTLTGPGGIGKTCLAHQIAAELVEDFPDGVWFVRLSRLVDPNLVLPTVAQTLGLKEQGSQPIADLLREYLHSKRVLLVLDNFEQVVGAAAEVATLQESAPWLKVLVTSRVSLHLRGEHEYPLSPLPLPDPAHLPAPGELTQYAAVALFIERASAVKPDFTVTSANAPAIAAICARLDGLPLAIVLAAAHIKLLPPEALLSRLSARLKLLTGGARDAEERQRTMQATLAWSEDLLTPEECMIFRRLAIFVGGCTLEAAEAVCAVPAGAEPLGCDVLEGLATLVDQSLVQQREEGGEPRCGMLHVIREYALDQLEASGEAEALGRAHAAYFVALAEEAEPWLLSGPRLPDAVMRLERELDNLRAVLGWAQAQGEAETGLRLASALVRFWWGWGRGHLREGRAWLDRLLTLAAEGQAVPGNVRAKALFAVGELATYQGEFTVAEPLLEQGLGLARAAGDEALTARVLNRLGSAAQEQGDLERATAWFEESLALARQLGYQDFIPVLQFNLGEVAYQRGDLTEAEAHFAASVARDRQVGDLTFLVCNLALWANTRRRQGDLPQSLKLLREAFMVLQDIGERAWPVYGAQYPLLAMAGTLAVAGRGEQAARLQGAAEALLETLGFPLGPFEQTDIEVAVAPARAALGEEQWAAAFAAGRALTLEEAVAEALEESSPG
jgi:predicted ATPase/class 3 adenylate cyclase